MKLSAKMGIGFGVLVIISGILGYVSVTGLMGVTANMELNQQAYACLNEMGKCANFRRDFAIYGFQGYGSDNKTAGEKWSLSHDAFLEKTKDLEKSKNLDNADKAIAADTISKMAGYPLRLI